MQVTDYLFAQLEAINFDRMKHLEKISNNNSKKCQDLIVKHVLKEQYQGYKEGVEKPSIFSLVDNFVSDHVKNTSQHLELFYESQANVKLFFLGLANITETDLNS